MHVDAPVADLVVDEPLLEQGGLLQAGKPDHRKYQSQKYEKYSREICYFGNLRTALPLTQLRDLRVPL